MGNGALGFIKVKRSVCDPTFSAVEEEVAAVAPPDHVSHLTRTDCVWERSSTFLCGWRWRWWRRGSRDRPPDQGNGNRIRWWRRRTWRICHKLYFFFAGGGGGGGGTALPKSFLVGGGRLGEGEGLSAIKFHSAERVRPCDLRKSSATLVT